MDKRNKHTKKMKKLEKRQEYKEKLGNLIKTLGEWNVNLTALSSEWNIPVPTLHRWKLQILKKMPIVAIEEMGREINRGMKQNLKICNQMINTAKSTREKCQAIDSYNKTVKQATEFLEQYGYKEKIANKIEHSGINPCPVEFILYPPDEKKDIKTDKPETSKLS